MPTSNSKRDVLSWLLDNLDGILQFTWDVHLYVYHGYPHRMSYLPTDVEAIALKGVLHFYHHPPDIHQRLADLEHLHADRQYLAPTLKHYYNFVYIMSLGTVMNDDRHMIAWICECYAIACRVHDQRFPEAVAITRRIVQETLLEHKRYYDVMDFIKVRSYVSNGKLFVFDYKGKF